MDEEAFVQLGSMLPREGGSGCGDGMGSGSSSRDSPEARGHKLLGIQDVPVVPWSVRQLPRSGLDVGHLLVVRRKKSAIILAVGGVGVGLLQS